MSKHLQKVNHCLQDLRQLSKIENIPLIDETLNHLLKFKQNEGGIEENYSKYFKELLSYKIHALIKEEGLDINYQITIDPRTSDRFLKIALDLLPTIQILFSIIKFKKKFLIEISPDDIHLSGHGHFSKSLKLKIIQRNLFKLRFLPLFDIRKEKTGKKNYGQDFINLKLKLCPPKFTPISFADNKILHINSFFTFYKINQKSFFNFFHQNYETLAIKEDKSYQLYKKGLFPQIQNSPLTYTHLPLLFNPINIVLPENSAIKNPSIESELQKDRTQGYHLRNTLDFFSIF